MKQNSTSTARLIMGVGLTAILVAAIVFGLTHYATANAAPNALGSATVVIAEVYGGAGCTTPGCSTYQRDYVVLYNRGTVAFSLSGRSVQYASATNTTTVSSQTNLPAFTLQPGQYFLVAEAFNANGADPLPIVPDITGTINMGATAGKVFLIANTTPLTLPVTGCPGTFSAVIDFVGYGTANCSEGGSPAPAPSTTTSDSRMLNGCQDSDLNSADFTAGAPNPRNSSTTLAPCNPPTAARLVSASASADDGLPVALGAVGVVVMVGSGVWTLRRRKPDSA